MKIIIKDNNIFKNKILSDKKLKILRLAKKYNFFNVDDLTPENMLQIDTSKRIRDLEYANLEFNDIIEIDATSRDTLLKNINITSSPLLKNKIFELNYLFLRIGSENSLEFYQKINSKEKLDHFYSELCEDLGKVKKGKLVENKLIYMINAKISTYKEIVEKKNIYDTILSDIWKVIDKVLSIEDLNITKLELSEEFNLFIKFYTSIKLKSNNEVKGQPKIKNFKELLRELEQEENLIKIKNKLLPLFSSRYVLKKDKQKLLVKFFQLKLLSKVHPYNLENDTHTMYLLFKELIEEENKNFKNELYDFLFLNYLASQQENITEKEKRIFKSLKEKYDMNQDMQYDPTKKYDLKKQYLFLSISEKNIKNPEEAKLQTIAYLKWLKQVINKKIFDEFDIFSLFLTSDFKTMVLYKYLFLKKIQFIKEIRIKEEINRTNAILRGEDIGTKELKKILENFDEILNFKEETRLKYKLVSNDREYIINSFYISNLLYDRILKNFDENSLVFPIYEKINISNRISKSYFIENQLVENIEFYPLENRVIEVDKNYVFYKIGIQKNETILFVGKCLAKITDETLLFKLVGIDYNYFEMNSGIFNLKDIFELKKEKIVGVLKKIEYVANN